MKDKIEVEEMKNACELLKTIALEKIEENIFRGKSHSIGSKRVYGGQVLAQSLAATMETVPENRLVHSMHGYFILPGDVNHPIIFNVDRIRDGGSFTTRRCVAIQHGRAIFNMAASFQLAQEGFEHQIEMPKVTPPEDLLTDQQLVEKYRDQLPEAYSAFIRNRPIEFRPVELPNLLDKGNASPFRHVWLRAKGEVPDIQNIHRTIMAYASDYNLLTTALRPHSIDLHEMQIASLDHAMWFHRNFKMNEWLLYALDSPSASNTRGFTRGNFFTRDGVLVASVTQEGMIRKRRKP